MSQPKKFVAQRTDQLDQVLQELWALRPELYRRNSATVYLGAVALLDEARSNKKQISVSSDEDLESGQETFPISEAVEASERAVASKAHPDSIWNF